MTERLMVTLQSRWKQNRSWNVRLYVGLLVTVVLCAVLVFALKALIMWATEVVPAAIPKVIGTRAEHDPKDEYRGEMVSQFEREFTVSGYTVVLPNDFELDVLPQPGDIPRGGRFTGVRFRVAQDDAAQLFLMVIDRPKEAEEENEAEPNLEKRLEAALDRLFARVSRNAAMVGVVRGDNEYGELGGLPYARCTFSGDYRGGRRAARVRCMGAALATIDEARDVFVYSLSETTTHHDDRKLMDSATLTLRRAGTPRQVETDEAQAGDGQTEETQESDSAVEE